MAPTQAVLVSAPDEAVSSLIAPLRDRWSTRTATTPAETKTSLDERVAVVIIDPAVESLSIDDLATMINDRVPDAQILQFGQSNDPSAGTADAVLTRGADEETLCSTVDRLQRRARYKRLLSRFYAKSRSRGEQPPEEQTDEGALKIADLKSELDEVAAELDDEDLFDAALE
ncbi:Rec domain [Halorhabdus sp. BNX81]|nr:Rec domain [Halorhabdus sp. BNX81]